MATLLRPDPTFYPSPRLAGEAPAETLAYMVTFDPTAATPDALLTVDVDPSSQTYRQVVGKLEFPNLGEKPVVRQPLPAELTGGLPKVRYAQAFAEFAQIDPAEVRSPGRARRVVARCVRTARSTRSRTVAGSTCSRRAGSSTSPRRKVTRAR